ncbi:MAG: class I SAM-dependent methyltransferase [Elusimicrobia bacterium]|nr:class I SAM-dependent methyltransferase [Elusimicrobiota bacterium]
MPDNWKGRIDRKFRWMSLFYDAFDLVFITAPSRNPCRILAEAVPPDARRILDVCAGTGRGALAVAAHRPGAQVIGIDLSVPMLAVAERKVPPKDRGRVTFRAMDAARLEFEDGSFDAAMISLALHELPPDLRARVLDEMVRVVKPGGRIYVADYDWPSAAVGRLLLRLFFLVFEPPHVLEFMRTDWPVEFDRRGCVLQEEKKALYTRILVGNKQREAQEK